MSIEMEVRLLRVFFHFGYASAMRGPKKSHPKRTENPSRDSEMVVYMREGNPHVYLSAHPKRKGKKL